MFTNLEVRVDEQALLGPPGADAEIAQRALLHVPTRVLVRLAPETVDELHLTPVTVTFVARIVDRGQPSRVIDDENPAGDWHYVVSGLRVGPDPDGDDLPGSVTERDLGAIRLGALVREAVVPFVWLAPYRLNPLLNDLDQVALRSYVAAQLADADPTKYVAECLEVSRNAAAQRVFRLRKAGYLPPVERGAH